MNIVYLDNTYNTNNRIPSDLLVDASHQFKLISLAIAANLCVVPVINNTARTRMISSIGSYTTDPHSGHVNDVTLDPSKVNALVYYVPDAFLRPALNEEGEVKSGIRFREGQLVKVERYSSGGSSLDRFVGAIESTSDDHMDIRILTVDHSFSSDRLIHNSRIYNDSSTRSKVVGKVVSVPKRNCRILDPYTMPMRSYALMNIDKRMRRFSISRESRLSPSLTKQYNYKKYHFAADRFTRTGVVQTNKIRGKIIAELIATFRKGELGLFYRAGDESTQQAIRRVRDYIESKLPAGVREYLRRLGSTSEALIKATSVMEYAITVYNSSLGDGSIDDSELLGRGVVNRAEDCGHYAFSGTIITARRPRGLAYICPHCAASNSRFGQVMDGNGEMVLFDLHYDTFRWSDGTRRSVAEPQIIGQYHSSKNYLGEVKLPAMPYAGSGLTMGIELEMESTTDIHEESTREGLARLVLARMLKAHEAANVDTKIRYGYFERDGSVQQGFEMVTGYGELAMHQHFIRNIFGAIEGEKKLPFVGKLRSHDASSSCGLHVHMAKPKSLAHAVKLQSFYNAEENKTLVRAVARRYDVSYTKVVRGKEKERVQQNASTAIRNTGYTIRGGGLSASNKRMVVNRSITNLTIERYEAVNYRNDKTVEIRIFKGSMLPTTILACIEFAHASWFFTRDYPANKITSDEFLAYIADPIRRHETANLRTYLAARGFKTYVPKFREGVTEIVEHDFNSPNA